ncbi:methyltransferase domain-containing protein [Micromonospora sp. R77]|uniref:methyltransferase n=1 Tax=Micromonospora sp. R77 TaxID=2925836 RepID=UPI001F61583E|nr:methyltransferase [Micromonospora sp. R77]MCI4061293.1 methyltransferase domain-containing protein [Micromonospora sp. R77]
MSALNVAVEAIHTVAALRAADRTGVLAELAAAPGPAEDVAARAGTNPRSTRLLLEALDAIGVVVAERGRFRLAVPGAEQIGGLLTSADRLDDTVRTGLPPVDVRTADGAGRLYPGAVAALSAAQHDIAGRVADVLGPGVRDVLDVAAGGGIYGIAVARRTPDVRITALDLPEVLPTTRAAVDVAGVADRFSFWGTDVLTVGEAPEPRFDAAVVANLCHLFDRATCADLLRRVAALLRPGGRVAVVDVLPATSEDAAARRSVALYALGLAGRTSTGDVHHLTDYRAWLADAGFDEPDIVPLGGSVPLSLVLARATAADRTPTTV